MDRLCRLKKVLNNSFSRDSYDEFISLFLKKKRLERINSLGNLPEQTFFRNYIENYDVLSEYKDLDGEKILILIVKIKDNKRITDGARTVHRNFVSYLLEHIYQDFSYALVAFFSDSDSTWKLSLVSIDYHITDQGLESYYKPVRRYSFLLGPDEPSKTYISQLKNIVTDPSKLPTCREIYDVFSVDKVTNDFYYEYREKYFELREILFNSSDFVGESNRLSIDLFTFACSFAKKTLGQIVFIYFLQRKGWLGVVEKWGDGDKRFLSNLIHDNSSKNIFNDLLEPLFYDALNEKRKDDIFTDTKVPFLNGGLFNPIKNYNWQNTNFKISNSYFSNKKENGFIDILDSYNFTVIESDPMEQEVAIDPEMLGRIFEKLLDVDERKGKGAFYTPREIVHYMCQTTLAKTISNKLDLDYDDIYRFVQYKDFIKTSKVISDNCFRIDKLLSELKVMDPALGSGAFLVGMLNEVSKIRNTITGFLLDYLKVSELPKDRSIYKLKIELIENSLFGVDIEPDAIEVAKLRLWLSLIVDENTVDDSAPEPLPNLTYNLRVGNSLMTSFKGVELENEFRIDKRTSRNKNSIRNIKSEIAKHKKDFYRLTDKNKKTKVAKRIDLLTFDYLHMMLYNNAEESKVLEYISEISNIGDTKPFFLWKFEFSKTFEEFEGFDIVIANPPYGIEFDSSEKKILKKKYKNVPDYESAYYFLAMSRGLLNKKGVMSFIIPNTVLTNVYAKKFRNELLKEMELLTICDLSQVSLFESAEVRNCILEIGSSRGSKDIELVKVNDSSSISMITHKLVEYDVLERNIGSWLNLFYLEPIDFQIVKKVQKATHVFNDFAEVSQGLIPYDKYRGHSEETIKNRIWHSTYCENETFKKELKGKDVNRYSLEWNKVNWISYGEWLAAPRRVEFFTEKRILVREITNPRMFACFSEEEYYNTPSIINLIGFKDASINYLLGLLNSKLYSYYHIKSSPKANKGSFPKILVNDVRNLPIIFGKKSELISGIESIVKNILSSDYPSGPPKAFDKDIDQLVYKLFDLTKEEIDRVESIIK